MEIDHVVEFRDLPIPPGWPVVGNLFQLKQERVHLIQDLKNRGLLNVMRASVHIYNTEDELDRFVTVLDAQRSHG